VEYGEPRGGERVAADGVAARLHILCDVMYTAQNEHRPEVSK
jgi:hypothetical protein